VVGIVSRTIAGGDPEFPDNGGGPFELVACVQQTPGRELLGPAATDLLEALQATPAGLTSDEVKARRAWAPVPVVTSAAAPSDSARRLTSVLVV
jgi:hypothetical protein